MAKVLSRYQRWRATWAHQPITPWVRLFAYLDMTLVDHGFLRPFYNRPYEFAPGMWRSNQPSPRQLRKLKQQIGLNTVLNFRGDESSGHYALEQEACAELGLKLVTRRLYSRDFPDVAVVKQLIHDFETLPKPMLLHCKSGADRAGLGAALYLITQQQQPVEQALEQLSLRFLHVKQAKTGLLDFLLETYAQAHAQTGIAFIDWLEQEFDPAALKPQFQVKGWASILVDWVLRRE